MSGMRLRISWEFRERYLNRMLDLVVRQEINSLKLKGTLDRFAAEFPRLLNEHELKLLNRFEQGQETLCKQVTEQIRAALFMNAVRTRHSKATVGQRHPNLTRPSGNFSDLK